jgi:tetratricopeptide (TPR) repeat protein
MGGAVRVELLGPVRLLVGDHVLPLRGTRNDRFVAALALAVGRVVAFDRLVEILWPEGPPASARRQVQDLGSRVRKHLAESGCDDEVLLTRSTGYLLALEPDAVDAHCFQATVAHARRIYPADPASATRLLRQALSLWRGDALTGADSEALAAERVGLDELRLAAHELVLQLDLDLGRHDDVLAELAELSQRHPLRERLVEMRMQALCRVGRAADALTAFHQLRQRLAGEQGTDPGPAVMATFQAILRDDPRLTDPGVVGRADHPAGILSQDRDLAASPSPPATEPPPAPGPPWDVPRQLPAPAQLFTGRVMELAELDKIHDASTVVITAIDGMAGVGKTALAVQAAHQMTDRYPDGQLFIDLHGYTDGVTPAKPDEALDWLLRSLGVPGERIPADLDQRAGLYRTRLAEQRMVIVLDNAATEAQVRPLLPGAPGCVVLVTSRRRLAGLDPTHTLSLDTLPLSDAIALLRETAGEGRLAGQPPELVEELAELCGRLPLAIRIAAARLGSHPAWDLAHLAARLRDHQHRLVELRAGERSVTAALDLSYQDLAGGQQRAYRLLGLHPGADIEPYAATALLDATLPEAGRLLEQLLEAHLLQEPTSGRYRFHDLIRAHAAYIATRDESQHGRHTALDRLLDYYRYAAAGATDAVYPFEPKRRPHVPAAHTLSPAVSDPAVALDWLDSELPNLLAAAWCASEHDRPTLVLHLSSILHRHLRTHGPYKDAETLHQHALTTARTTGDQAAEAEALIRLAHIHRLQARYEQATNHFAQALQLARATGHQAVEAEALVGLGNVDRMQGRRAQAIDHLSRALELARATAHPAAELDALVGLGHVHRMQGRYEQATDHYQQALRLARSTGHRSGEQNAVNALGHIYRVLGQHELAADQYQQALQLARAIGDRSGEQQALSDLGAIHRTQGAYELASDRYQQALQLARATGNGNGEQAALAGLGLVLHVRGRHEQATGHYQRLLDLAHESGNRNWQFEAWQGLGRTHHATGHPEAALTHHDRALTLATELGQPEDQARAHNGLAHAHHALHQPERARAHWQQALDILARLGIDHTDDEDTTVTAISAHLVTLKTGTEGTEPTT